VLGVGGDGGGGGHGGSVTESGVKVLRCQGCLRTPVNDVSGLYKSQDSAR
jgi:hypothetical protein